MTEYTNSANLNAPNGKGSSTTKKLDCPTYKYSNKGNGQLHEAIILSGLPVFLKYENGEIISVNQIEESARIIKPPNSEEYPYGE